MPSTSATQLDRLASNLRWTWHHPTSTLLASLPGATAGVHPLATIAGAPADELERWCAANADRLAQLATELDGVVAAAPVADVAYFSPEFGIAAEVPQYSGGLGILAGDHLKAVSDLGVPLLGVGLLYRQGFFRQAIEDGHQTERYETVVPEHIGAVDTGEMVDIEIGGRTVTLRIWRQMVGATTLVLLDSDVDTNATHDRAITDRLYSGDRRHRLDQELVLGVGGVRALRALQIAPAVFHLNEGHACFLLLELLREQIDAGASLTAAIETVRSRTLFTTHTPVPAGIDRFDRALISPELAPWAERLGVTTETILDWGHLPSDPADKPFNTAALAFELCGMANGVSQLHAEVSRELFSTLPRAQTVEGITNGVHARTWVIPPLQELYDDVLGSGWENGAPDAWANVDKIDPAVFGDIRRAGRVEISTLVANTTGVSLDPDRCIIGFARRFATYKRAALLLRDPDGMAASLAAGAQFVFAGKAHPADDEGKAVLAEVAAFAASEGAADQLVIVPDYDIEVARAMYGGCDVWLNNPIRPREACGTSGEKAALNGGLNCSILDGWWADWYVDGIGWAIPTSDATDADVRDDAEAVALHTVLADVLARFDDADAWFATVQAMLAHLGPLVTAGRMVSEYERRFYAPLRTS